MPGSEKQSKKSLKRGRKKQKIQPYLSPDLYDRFKDFAQKSRGTESGIVEDALNCYLDDSYDAVAVLKRLTSLESRNKRIERDLHIMTEIILLYVKVWYAHAPEIKEEDRGAAEELASKRYRAFVDSIRTVLSNQGPLIEHLVKESVADLTDLEGIIQAYSEKK